MKAVVALLSATLVFAQSPDIRKERRGMTQSQVINAEGLNPLKRKAGTLVYRDTESGIPAQVVFEFTGGRLDQVSYVADSPEIPRSLS
jgi:hypothetical protein